MTSRTAQLLCGVALVLLVSSGSPAQFRRQPIGKLRPNSGFRKARRGAPPLPPILVRVVQAAPKLRLSGTRVVDQLVKGRLVRHEEDVLRDGVRTRISFPEGSPFSGQIIVDNGTLRWRFNPRNRRVTQEPSQRDDTLNRLIGRDNRLLAPRIVLGDGGVIAGVSTTLAKVLNRQGVTVQELYVDPHSGAVLKRVGYDKSGQEVANYEFTSVQYRPRVEASSFARPQGIGPVITPELQLRRIIARADFPGLMVKRGQGFNLVNTKIANRAGVQVMHQVYLGPNGRLSVFLLHASIDPEKLVQRAGKFINAYSTQVDGVTVVLVGPYPRDYLEKLASTLARP